MDKSRGYDNDNRVDVSRDQYKQSATSNQRQATNSWRTQLQPIRTIGEITTHIKILPARQPYLYQKLSIKTTQLRLLGMSHGQIAENLNINRKTAIKACEYQGR